MSDPIWKRTDITVTEHRLMWFLIDVGGMGKVVGHGWMTKCSESMNIHRVTVNRVVRRLVAKGLLRHAGKGQVEFNMSGFESPLPEHFVRLKEIKSEFDKTPA